MVQAAFRSPRGVAMTHVSVNRAILPCLFACLISARLGAQAQAQGQGPVEEGRVMIWGAIGFQGDFGGNVSSSGVGTLNGRRAELDANTGGERYDPGPVLQAGGAYNLTGDSQLTGSVGWEQAESDAAEAGLLAGVPIEVGFSDYQAWGFDIGYRQFLASNYTARPFVGGALGFQHVDAITIDMTSP